MFEMYGSTHKDFFTNEYLRSLLELSISCLHRCVNILTIKSLRDDFICIANELRLPSLV